MNGRALEGGITLGSVDTSDIYERGFSEKEQYLSDFCWDCMGAKYLSARAEADYGEFVNEVMETPAVRSLLAEEKEFRDLIRCEIETVIGIVRDMDIPVMETDIRYLQEELMGKSESALGTERNRSIKAMLRLCKPMVLAALITAFLMHFVFINAYVPTGSMEPAIMTGDRIFGLRLLHDYRRGDIVIFPDTDGSGLYLVKRIIGMPGDMLEIRGGEVFINGSLLEEGYLRETMVGRGFLYSAAGGWILCHGG